MELAAEVQGSTIPVSRVWREIAPSAFIGEAPSKEEIAQWRNDFEKANPMDSVEVYDLNYYKGVEQYLCVRDFIEVFYGPEHDMTHDRRTQWRLLQYGGGEPGQAKTELEKVLHLKEVCKDILDFQYASQWEITFHSCLARDFQDFYIRLMYDVCAKLLDKEASASLRAEQAAARKGLANACSAYQKIDGAPDGEDGSSYPSRIATFEAITQRMELNALDALLRSVITDSLVLSPSFVPLKEAKALVEREYKTFPVKAGKAEMKQDRKSWDAWMAQRDKVSSLLAGNAQKTYDSATIGICRYKLIMLKNRYIYDEYKPSFYDKILLPHEGVSTEEILAHNFEKLYKEALNEK